MKKIYLVGISAILLAGCNSPATNTNANVSLVNGNVSNINANLSNLNTNSSVNSTNPVSGFTIETKEPEQYQATVTLKLETQGTQNNPSLPPLIAQVARNGADKRMEFTLPGGEKVIYLDRADKRFLISPNRKQYAEITAESVGFDVRRVMTPAEIVERTKNLKGVEKVGEETINGRQIVKYRYGSVTNTKTQQAGQVATEAFILVDKETGLPLRSEMVSQSISGGNVQGVQSLRVVTEMSNIQATAPPELFAEPAGYEKVAPEQVRAQVQAVFQVAGTFLGQMLQNQNQQNPATAPTTSPTSSPAMSPTP